MRNRVGTAFLPDRLRCVCCVFFLQWQWRDRRQNNDRGDNRGRGWSSGWSRGWSSGWSGGWSGGCISISISVITIAESFLCSGMLSLSCRKAMGAVLLVLGHVVFGERSSVAGYTDEALPCPAATRRSRICLDADQTRCRRLECVQGCLWVELVVSRWRVPRHGRRVAGRQTPRGRARPRTRRCERERESGRGRGQLQRGRSGRRRQRRRLMWLRHRGRSRARMILGRVGPQIPDPVARVDDGGMRRTRERWSIGEVSLFAGALSPAGNVTWRKWPAKDL